MSNLKEPSYQESLGKPLGQILTERLVETFREEGWRVTLEPTLGKGADLVVRRGGESYAALLAVSRDARHATIEALLARAILVSRTAARHFGAVPLAVVGAPTVSDGILRRLEAFARSYGENTPWGVLDGDGLVVLFGPHLDSIRRERSRKRRLGVPSRVDLFSDLSQWMLKVLINHRLPDQLKLSVAPKPAPSVARLAELARVAVPTVNRFVRTLRAEGYCEDQLPLKTIRDEELLEKWRAANTRTPTELRTRWIFRPKNPDAYLYERLRNERIRKIGRTCLGLFSACTVQGLGMVQGVAPHLYVESVSTDVLQALGLTVVDSHEAVDVFVRIPRFPEAVFRASRTVDGVPVTDVLQCWLDVSSHPSRGAEMAEFLFNKVIRPNIIQGTRPQ